MSNSNLEKKSINLAGAAPNAHLYSQALVVGGMAYLSGVTGVDPSTGNLTEGTVGDRTTQIFKNISTILEAAGSQIDQTVKVGIYLTSMSDYKTMNDAYVKVFTQGAKPVRTCVAVKELPRGTDVEIEVIAIVNNSN
ncbi:hypothetical protein FSARC_3561 [Fusarium sarcochroum]|uniref:Uncharacterized protein n=1 Tax=Fusarium sarcochroum TaxID=1208366 RepID=A0A8H4XCC6_9HYPO|nr:hypothetical protein FSARC_3561 [Fusarium sarcochroum]